MYNREHVCFFMNFDILRLFFYISSIFTPIYAILLVIHKIYNLNYINMILIILTGKSENL
jgi:hypothetical protein